MDLAIHHFFFDDIKMLAKLLIRIADKRDIKGFFGDEVLMGFDAIARYTNDLIALVLELIF